MSGLNIEWAIGELENFIDITEMHNLSSSEPGFSFVTSRSGTKAPDKIVTQRAPVVEKILDRVIPDWRTTVPDNSANNRWSRHREAAIRALALLQREQEISEKLGDGAPEISAGDLHPWVWSGAASLWQSGHFRSAVEDAAKKVNAETQNKVGRRDLSETKLFQDAFSLDAAKEGKPRLRRAKADDSDTYRSLQRGAMALAEGIYAGIRNPLNHESPEDIEEQIALEYLAALSVLARWVDESALEEDE